MWTRTWARGNPRIQTTYACNNAGDLETVTYNDGTPSITFTYDWRGRQATVARNSITTTLKCNDPSLLIGESYSGGTLTGLYVTNIYDNYLRRTQLASKTAGGGTLSTATYGYDNASRLQSVRDGTNSATYSCVANSLNQYSSREVPNAVDVLGIANGVSTVTVNSQATYRRGEYYHKALSIDNSAAAQYPDVTATAVNGGSSSNLTGKVFLPKTPENFGYDLDGNLTNDGRWAFTWDAENRLVKLESLASGPSGSKRRLEFEYDWQGRRIKKKVTNLDTGSILLDNKFLYERWNLDAELNATNNAVIRSYMWGLDPSGSLAGQATIGAGGVGGLLAVNDSANGVHFVAYDGNGNVAALVKAAADTVSAQYEYGPFAEPIRLTGQMGKVNPLRFSTKYTDDETDLVSYGARFYNQVGSISVSTAGTANKPSPATASPPPFSTTMPTSF